MSEVCGAIHPDLPTIACDKTTPCLGYHACGEEIWGITDLPEATSKAVRAGRLEDAASRVEPALSTGAPIARSTDPVTSHVAAADVKMRAGSYRVRLLRVYQRANGSALTDRQASALAELPEGGWKRCSELRRGGYITENGDPVIEPATGALVMACVVTEKGLAERV